MVRLNDIGACVQQCRNNMVRLNDIGACVNAAFKCTMLFRHWQIYGMTHLGSKIRIKNGNVGERVELELRQKRRTRTVRAPAAA